MTSAPSNLLAVRNLLLTHLDVDPDSVRVADLEPAEVGIVGNAAHRGGYHCGRDRVVPNDYSVFESKRDTAGLSSYASALDVGNFSHKGHDLRSFSVWCVLQCKMDRPDTRDIREIIYSPDGKTVKRWDRLGRRSSGDSSHLYHTHFSFFRDATRDGRDLRPLFRRYLTAIGLIESEDDMSADDATVGFVRALNYASNPENPAWTDAQAQYGRQVRKALTEIFGAESTSPAELTEALAPIREDLSRVQSGGMTADEFVDAVARRLGSPSA